jgi:hypothetical protein
MFCVVLPIIGTSWYTIHTLLTPPPLIQIVPSRPQYATKRLVRKSKLNDYFCQDSLPQSLTLQRQLHQSWMAKQAEQFYIFYGLKMASVNC